MDKLGECNTKIKKEKGERGLFPKIRTSLRDMKEEIKDDRRALVYDLAVFVTGFLFSRCQIIVGARPLGISLVALLTNGVWPALIGVSIGSLSLGIDGIIFAVAAIVTALLRLIVSISDKNESGETTLFCESLLLRISITVLSGFAVAAYEVLMRGLNEGSLLFGLIMVIVTPMLTFILSGVCSQSIGFFDIMSGSEDVLRISGVEKNEKYDRIFFSISALALIFFISLSIKDINILGITLTYVFSAAVTLLTAKRFGAMRAMAVGFISSLVLKESLAVSFALVGLCAGVMFSFGSGYAIVAGGVALCAWSAYASGLNGLLGSLPEYAIASTLTLPMLKRVSDTPKEEPAPDTKESAADMVGTMALAYQNEYVGSLDSLDSVLSKISEVVGEYTASPSQMSVDEIDCKIKGQQEICFMQDSVNAAEEYELVAKLISQAKAHDISEKTVDNSMTDVLTAAFEECGFTNGMIRVFGNRRRHFILAGEDEGGAKISSFELRKSIEKAADVKLGTPEYFRRGKMVLMECGIRPAYKVSYATAGAQGKENEISGDTSVCFESKKDYFYSVISDGMGSGEVAKRTSKFVCDFIKCAMDIGSAKETLIHILNHTIRLKNEEYSTTVDLFELDLLNGNGVFLKSGAAPSYVKRDSSIFRIRSQTAPIGLMRTIDSEKISVEIRSGDHIIMFSDGIAEIAEDAPWLLLLLGEPPKENLTEYANLILSEAKKNSVKTDDMTVTVIRIEEA